MAELDPKRIVREGYDRIAETYRQWAGAIHDEERARHTTWIMEHVPAGAPLLELGCGNGIPSTQILAERFAVTGVDLSTAQLALVRASVPGATFIQADMTALDFSPASFAAVVAFYSLTHVPRDEHPALLAAIARWLRPGGWFVASMGARETVGDVEADWLGAPMYFSHWGSATNRRLVAEAGLEIVSAEEATLDENGTPATFLWVVARLPVPPTA